MKYEASDEGWKLVSTMFGVKVWSTPGDDESGSSLVVCRGQVPLTPDVTFELLRTQFIKVFNTSKTLAEQMRASDPMSRETKILCQVWIFLLPPSLQCDVTERVDAHISAHFVVVCMSCRCWDSPPPPRDMN